MRASAPVLDEARAKAGGTGGPALLETFDRFNRSLADAPALRQFVEAEREAALRIITSRNGVVQPRMVEMITELISAEVESGASSRRSSRPSSPTRSCAWPRRSCSTTRRSAHGATWIGCERSRLPCCTSRPDPARGRASA